MKKIIIIFISLIYLLAFISTSDCSMNKESTTNNSSQFRSESLKQDSSTSTSDKQYFFDFSGMNSEDVGFYDDVSWFRFLRETPGSTINSADFNYGCVDKNGKMLFEVSGVQKPTFFENGYSHLLSNDGLKVTVINKKGEVLSSYNTISTTYDNNINAEIQKGDLSNCCISYGYGCSVVKKDNSTFKESNNEYIIYDANMNNLYSFSTDKNEEIEVSYLGQGVFVFKNKGMFFAKSKKWADYSTNKKFSCGINMIYYDTIYNTVDGNDTMEIQYLNSNGEIISTGTLSRKEYGWDSVSTPVVNNMSLIYDNHSGNYIIYNLEKGTFSKLTDKTYLNGITDDSQIFIDNGEIIITINGEDGKNYVISFDSEWNLYMIPTEYDKIIDESCGRVIIDMDKIYNLDGRKIFSLVEDLYIYNADFRTKYNEDILIVKKKDNNSKVYAALDLDGNEVFNTDNIDISTSNTLII